MLHIEKNFAVVRWYDEPDGFEKKLPYRAVCSLFYLEPDHVFIYAMHGNLSKKDMRDLFERLHSEGILKVTAQRKGKLVTKDIAFLLSRS